MSKYLKEVAELAEGRMSVSRKLNANRSIANRTDGNQIFRFVLVCLAGLIFVPYCAIFKPKYYPLKK